MEYKEEYSRGHFDSQEVKQESYDDTHPNEMFFQRAASKESSKIEGPEIVQELLFAYKEELQKLKLLSHGLERELNEQTDALTRDQENLPDLTAKQQKLAARLQEVTHQLKERERSVLPILKRLRQVVMTPINPEQRN